MQQNFHVRNFENSNGMLREIPFDVVEFLPVTGSHAFAALNIIEGCVRGFDPQLCGDDGMIDLQKVLKLCPSWKKTNGGRNSMHCL